MSSMAVVWPISFSVPSLFIVFPKQWWGQLGNPIWRVMFPERVFLMAGVHEKTRPSLWSNPTLCTGHWPLHQLAVARYGGTYFCSYSLTMVSAMVVYMTSHRTLYNGRGFPLFWKAAQTMKQSQTYSQCWFLTTWPSPSSHYNYQGPSTASAS